MCVGVCVSVCGDMLLTERMRIILRRILSELRASVLDRIGVLGFAHTIAEGLDLRGQGSHE